MVEKISSYLNIKEVIGMLFIEQVYEKSNIKSDYVRCPSCKREGCAVVEMECSALAACADFRGATWGMILYTADSLADVDKYDERNWGGNAYEYALTLSLDAVIKL